MPLDRRARLVERQVSGFVFDVSDTGARIAVWATGALEGGTVLVWIEGEESVRLGVVRWARAHPDGSIVGIEFVVDREAPQHAPYS